MATPYFQKRFETVPSTQDVASEGFVDLPLLVIAAAQTRGRGRSGSGWVNADRGLAASLAFSHDEGDQRPLSLMAGVAAIHALGDVTVKWPNDVLSGEAKVGGILVERRTGLSVVGLGLNIWWADPPVGMSGLLEDDPGPERHAEIGALWGAEMMELIDRPGWPREEYIEYCSSIGRRIEWDPGGSGLALAVAEDGALVVDSGDGEETIYSGEVRHIRPSD